MVPNKESEKGARSTNVHVYALSIRWCCLFVKNLVLDFYLDP